MNLYTNKWEEDSGFILGFENDKDFNYLYVEVQYTEFFGRWFYLYGAYLADVKKHYLVMYNPFQDKWYDSLSPVVKKLPILDFYQFSVCSADIKKSV